MSYATECTGNIDVDINWSSVDQQGGNYLYKESAKAIKINPTSRCLDFITFYDVRRITNTGIYVEIRNDDGGKPSGNPGSATGRLVETSVPYANIPTSFGSVTVDTAVVLPSLGSYWVVIRPSDFSCISGSANQRTEFSWHWLSENRSMVYGYSDLYCSPAGCCWYGLDYDVLPIATHKKTYSPPACTNPNCAFVMA